MGGGLLLQHPLGVMMSKTNCSPRNSAYPCLSLEGSYAERFRTIEVFARTAHSMVCLCADSNADGAPVVLKLSCMDAAADETEQERFCREIRALFTVSHPNVIRIIDVINDGRQLGYVMEYAAGRDLASHISPDRNFSAAEVIRIGTQVCAGLDAVHAAGMIHRSLKPEHILLDADGNIKLAGFGLVHIKQLKRLTKDGEILGPAASAAPEYVRYGVLDQRSDIYAVGLILYEMLSGALPFGGYPVAEGLRLRLSEDAPDLSALRPDCPEELCDIIMRAISRNPFGRQQSAQELLRELHLLSDYAASFPENEAGQNHWPDESLFVPEAEKTAHSGRRTFELKFNKLNRNWRWMGWISALAAVLLLFLVLTSAFPVPSRVTASAVPAPAESAALPSVDDTEPLPQETVHETARETKSAAEGITPSAPPHQEEPPAQEYTVQQGDSLWKIAARYSVSAKQLAAANGITDPYRLRLGLKLQIPAES